jgi:hypothetical protein
MSMRRVLACLFTGAALLAAGCGGPDEIRSVRDFDEAPCLLIDGPTMTTVVTEPLRVLTGSDPKLVGEPEASDSDGTHACVYSFVPSAPSAVPPVQTLTVTVARSDNGSQPLALCVAGEAAGTGGYKSHKVGDQACVSPTTDLWMRVAGNFFHVVAVPQPGFDRPVDMNLALTPLLVKVAEAVASRMPRG